MRYIIVSMLFAVICGCGQNDDISCILDKKNIVIDDSTQIVIDSINREIVKYAKKNDYYSLSKLYNNKGRIYLRTDELDTAVNCYKNAEYFAQDVNDPELRYYIAWGLCAINCNTGNLRLSLEYAKKRNAIAQEDLDQYAKASSLLALAIAYQSNDMNDSARIVCERLIMLDKYISYNEKLYYYYLLGKLCEEIDFDRAIQYYETGASLGYYQNTYTNLAKHYLSAGRIDDAEKLIKRVMDSSSYEAQIDLFNALSALEKDNGNYPQALYYATKVIVLKDSLQDRISNCRIVESQYDFECKLIEIEQQKRISYFKFSMVIIVLSIVLVLLLIRYRTLNDYKRKADTELEIRRLREQLLEYKSSDEISQQQIDELTKRLEIKEKEWSSNSNNIEILVGQIAQNHSIIKWSNEDIRYFVEYSVTTDPKLNDVFSHYISLSLNDKLFLVFESLGKTDDNIQEILGISASAVRMRRSRIGKKKK